MQVAVVLFTRDLRVHDNPALAAAVEAAETVLPLFVVDDGIGSTRFGAAARPTRLPPASRSPTSTRPSAGSAARSMCVGVRLSRRRCRAARTCGATTVFASADVSPYAVARQRRLAAELDLRLVDGNYVVPAGEVAPVGNDYYQVFSPYHRAWSEAPWGSPLPAPRAIRLPDGIEPNVVEPRR